MMTDRMWTTSVLLGFLATPASVGACAPGLVMLVYLYPHRLPAAKLVGTDAAHAVRLTQVADLGHLGLDNVELLPAWVTARRISPGHHPGLASELNANRRSVRNAIAFMLATVGGRILLHTETPVLPDKSRGQLSEDDLIS